MAGNIKGVTIEFKGETTKLDKALSQVKKETKGIDSELRQVNDALKFNPKNTELLSQKMNLLKQKIDVTEDSLKELKDAQAQMDAKGVDKNSEEYRKLQREIITTESKLKHFKGEFDKVKNVKLTALGKQLEDVGKKAKTAGDNMSKYVTGPIMAAGGASAVAFNGVSDSLNIIANLTGATGKDLVAMQNIFKDMSKSIPADMDDIANAIGEVNTRFGLTGDKLQKVSEKFVKFADVNGTDVIASIDGVQKAMSAYGLSAEDTGYVLDVLTKAAQNTGVSVERLYSGLVSNSTAFQELGLDINQSATLMGQLEKSGANAETVTNGLRKALKYAAQEGKPLSQVLVELQGDIQNSKNDTEGLAKAYEVFGKSGDQMYGVIKSGALDFAALADASTDASGALETTFDVTMTPAKRFGIVLNELKLLGYEIGNAVLPTVMKVIRKLEGIVEKMLNVWNKLGPKTQKTIIAIVAAIAAIGPALSIAGRIMTGFGKILQNVGTIIGGFSKALTFLAANPIGLAIAGIAAFIAIIVLLWKKSETFRTIVTTAFNAVKTVVLAAWDAIRTKWAQAVAFFKSLVTGIKSVFNGVGTWLANTFGNAWTAIKNKFAGWGSFWSGLWGKVKNAFSSIGSNMASAISGAIKSGVNKVISKVESIINSAISLINSAIDLANKLPGVTVGHVKKLSLPRMAKGGVLMDAQAVIAGEAGPEAIIPLDKLWTQMDAMANKIVAGSSAAIVSQAMMAAVAQMGQMITQSMPDDIVLNINGKEVASAIWGDLDNEAIRRGGMFAPTVNQIKGARV